MRRRDASARVLLLFGMTALIAYGYLIFRGGWSEQAAFGTPGSTAVRYWPMALLAAALLAAIRLRPPTRTVAASLSVLLVSLLYAAELLLAASSAGVGIAPSVPIFAVDLAATDSKKRIGAAAARFGVNVDLRDRIDVLTDMRARGVDAVPAVMLSDLLSRDDTGTATLFNAKALMPLGGIANTVTVLCNQASPEYVTYTSDEHGFRNPAGAWTSGRLDIAVVGQSHVQGYCLPDGQGFVDLLRTRDRRVLNLGMSGAGALLQLAGIREYLRPYAPRVVLWCYSEGLDLSDFEIESTWVSLKRYLDPGFSQRLLTRQTEVDDSLRTYVSARESRERSRQSVSAGGSFVGRSLDIVKLSHLRYKVDLVYGSNDSGSTAEGDSLMRDILKEAQSETSAWGGRLYMVYLPNWTRFRNGPRPSDRERRRITAIPEGLGIPVIDVTPAFEAQPDPLSLFPLRIFGHYNKAGSRLVAETITNYLNAVTHSASEP